MRPADLAESPIPFRRRHLTPADQSDACLREIDARDAARPRRQSGVRTSWPQRAAALAADIALRALILAGLSRQVLGWP